jgi:hypothetical protein
MRRCLCASRDKSRQNKLSRLLQSIHAGHRRFCVKVATKALVVTQWVATSRDKGRDKKSRQVATSRDNVFVWASVYAGQSRDKVVATSRDKPFPLTGQSYLRLGQCLCGCSVVVFSSTDNINRIALKGFIRSYPNGGLGAPRVALSRGHGRIVELCVDFGAFFKKVEKGVRSIASISIWTRLESPWRRFFGKGYRWIWVGV